MTGELFALLRQHGTLASAMQTAGADAASGLQHANVADDPEFLRGVAAAAAGPALTHALFGARARVVTGALAPAAAAAYVSGLLIGAEWADAQRLASRDEPVRVIGEPALASAARRLRPSPRPTPRVARRAADPAGRLARAGHRGDFPA